MSLKTVHMTVATCNCCGTTQQIKDAGWQEVPAGWAKVEVEIEKEGSEDDYDDLNYCIPCWSDLKIKMLRNAPSKDDEEDEEDDLD